MRPMVLAVCAVLAVPASAEAQQPTPGQPEWNDEQAREKTRTHRFVDKVVGGFRVAERPGAFLDVEKALGPARATETCGHTCRCYYSEGDRAFIRFGLGPDEWIESIEVLADRPGDGSCDGAPVVARHRFKTGKGLGLGSLRQEVVAAYGPPTRKQGIDELRWETTFDKDAAVQLVYSAIFRFRDGRVVSFEIYDGE